MQTESDVTGVLAAVTARQRDSSRFRWWEIVGAAHGDTYLLGAAFSVSGNLPPAELARLMAPTAEPLGIPRPMPVNSGPQHHYLAQAAIAHLDRSAGRRRPARPGSRPTRMIVCGWSPTTRASPAAASGRAESTYRPPRCPDSPRPAPSGSAFSWAPRACSTPPTWRAAILPGRASTPPRFVGVDRAAQLASPAADAGPCRPNRYGAYRIMLFIGIAMFGIFFFTLFMRTVLGCSMVRSGISHLPFVVGILATARQASPLMARIGTGG